MCGVERSNAGRTAEEKSMVASKYIQWTYNFGTFCRML